MKYPKDHSSFIIFPSKKIIFSLIFCLFLSLFLTIYSLKSLYSPLSLPIHVSIPEPEPEPAPSPDPTNLNHIIFGIGAAANKWGRRKEFIKLWWQPNITRGYVFLDRPVTLSKTEKLNEYPTLKISEDTNKFNNPTKSRDGIRITRIVSELVRMGLEDVRWYVMGDDDTIFFPDNLVRVLQKYDHNKMYYIGSNSETHMQNLNFAHDMAFGGGGFAISYTLALAIEKIQDRCLRRYTGLYGSDDRIQACVAELGVSLTKEPGFHQFDVYGNLFGILTAHPIAPLVSLHHLEKVDPIFPYMGRLQALQRLKVPSKLDSYSLMQQSICYDTIRNWTISVSWGYAVQIIRGIITPREMQKPSRTFFNWYKRDEPSSFSFSTKPLSKHPCEKPYIYYLTNGVFNDMVNESVTNYLMHQMPHPWCWWDMVDNPQKIHRVQVYKKPNPNKWDEAPRRDCCRVLQTDKQDTLVVNVGECREGEAIEPL